MPTNAAPRPKQVPLAEVERGLTWQIATLDLAPAEITQQYGVRFEEGEDDLDKLQAAVLRTVEGCQFALVRHDHQPEPGTEIVINERSQDVGADLRQVLNTLQLGAKTLRWIHPDAKGASRTTKLPVSGVKVVEAPKSISVPSGLVGKVSFRAGGTSAKRDRKGLVRRVVKVLGPGGKGISKEELLEKMKATHQKLERAGRPAAKSKK